MFLHFPACPVWWIQGGRCTCPREWRIRKNQTATSALQRERPWRVFRRLDDGRYTLAFHAPSQSEAIQMVNAITVIADRNPLLRRVRTGR